MSVGNVWQNPILLRTQRQSARLQRTPWIVLTLVVALTLLVASVGGIAAESGDPAAVGTGVFAVFFSMASFFVTTIGAFLGGHALSSEHQGRTWEMLLLTGLTPRRIVTGKLVSALANVLFYLVALSPISAVAFLFGGVGAIEMLFGFVFLVALAALSVAFGLAVASAAPQHGSVWAVLSMVSLFVGLGPFFGWGGAALVQAMWPALRGDSPVWWPAAVTRAPIDLRYLLFVWAIPTSAFALPTWLGIELAVAQVSEPGQDRLYSFKRALLVATAITCAVSCATLVAASDQDRILASLVFAFGLHLLLAMALASLASDDLYPSRRARHDLRTASAGRRLLGPSVLRGSLLFLFGWMLSLLVVSAVGAYQLVQYSAPSYESAAILVSDLTIIPFVLFSTGLLVFLRSAGRAPMVARLLLAVVVLVLTGAPWVLYAIAGGISHHDSASLLILGAPSPAYAIAMMSTLKNASGDDSQLILGGGMVMALVYLLAGLAFFAAAARRTRKTEDAELAYQNDVDRRLAEEDRQDAAAAAAAAEGA